MKARHYRSVWLLLALAIGVCPGCTADPNALQPLSGKVTFQGQPLAQGTIAFFGREEPEQRLSGAMLQEGRFHVAADFGLPPGTYKVKISSPETPANPEMIGGYPVNVERIPAEFNKNSKLVIEVKPGGGNVFDFSIP